ncbi:MAG: ATP-binding cassette domain-containing protein [Burkholderiales bacterium]|nr:ATP-binding cassette domain-containing protein [Burkholderiales bacterium]
MIEIRDARKVFHAGTPDARTALDGVSLALPDGAFAVLIGSNGAGKSTLLNAIAGNVSLDSGSIRIAMSDVTREPVERRAARIARVFQDPMAGTAATMTVEENLLLAALRGKPARLRWGLTAPRRALYRERLAELGLGLEDRLGGKVGLLSGGQRQALALVMAVLRTPDVLLLDEHTAALDPRTAALVLAATVHVIARDRLTAVMVTHNMNQALSCGSMIVMMENGRIKLTLEGEAKRNATVPDLVARFGEADDKILLAR